MAIINTGLLLLLVTSLVTCEEDVSPLVESSSGKIMGLEDVSSNGNPFFAYYAIPFAAPPVGELRFKNPQLVKNWDDVREKTTYPTPCPQVGRFVSPFNPQYGGEEDCLYLNVFTPSPNQYDLKLPIMVFIHGGAFTEGSTDQYPPYVMMNHNIIFVTIQYRLGVLGFLSTEDDEAPGNLGLKDQAIALSWIQTNAHLFGGDPIKITIFGESAGAASVHYQILSPRSLGFFQRAIMMSGSALAPFATGGVYKEVSEFIGSKFNCTTNEGSATIISCLQKVPVKELVQMESLLKIWHMNPFIFAPRVDDDFIPADPERLMKEKRHKRIEIMSGITSHEGASFTIPMYANEGYRSALMLNFAEVGPVSMEFSDGDFAPLNQTIQIYDRYVGGMNINAEHVDNLTQMFSDRYFTIPHDLTTEMFAKNLLKHKKNVFQYEFTYRGQKSWTDMYDIPLGQHYVAHGDDLFYLFSGGLWGTLENENDLQMSEIMSTLWVNFATHGDPTPDESLGFKWDPMTPEGNIHLNLKLKPIMEDYSRTETLEFWTSLPLRQNLMLFPERVSNLTAVLKKDEDEEEGEEVPVEIPEEDDISKGKESKGDTETQESKEKALHEENRKDEL